MDLKLGLHSFVYLWKTSVEDAFKKLADQGYRYIEISTAPPQFWPRRIDGKEREKIRNAAFKAGVEIVSTNPSGQDMNLASTNPGIYEETIIQLKEQLRLTHDLGAKTLVFPGGKVHSLVPAPLEEAKKLAKEGLIRCLEEAEKSQVVFGLENVPFSFIKTAEDLLEMVEAINHPYLKIVYDVANGFMVEDPAYGLEKVAPYLDLVHISDTSKNLWGHWPLGHGEVDFDAVANKLREINYTGFTILEVIDLEDPEGGFEISTQIAEKLGWKRFS